MLPHVDGRDEVFALFRSEYPFPVADAAHVVNSPLTTQHSDKFTTWNIAPIGDTFWVGAIQQPQSIGQGRQRVRLWVNGPTALDILDGLLVQSCCQLQV